MSSKPDGALTGLLYELDQQQQAADNHMAAEGHNAQTVTVLDSYDRTLHPWMHGRRPPDIARTAREWWHLALKRAGRSA